VNYEDKILLQKKYNLSENDYIVLHVGPITETRNLRVLTDLQ